MYLCFAVKFSEKDRNENSQAAILIHK